MSKTYNKDKNTKIFITTAIIGSIILLIGIVFSFFEHKKLDGKELAIGEVVDIKETTIQTSHGPETSTKVDIMFLGRGIDECHLERDLKKNENINLGDEVAIYYNILNSNDAFEYKTLNWVYASIILIGAVTIFVSLFFLWKIFQKEKLEESERNIKSVTKREFSIDDNVREDIANKVHIAEQQQELIDDEMEKINKDNDVSLLQKRMAQANSQLNTGSMVGNINIPSFNSYQQGRNNQQNYGNMQGYNNQMNGNQPQKPYYNQ